MNEGAARGTRHFLWRTLAWGATLAVIAGTLLPAQHMPRANVLALDKVIHLVAFCGLAALWRLASLSVKRTIVLVMALAVGTELAQRLMGAGRQWELGDIAADAIGMVIGLVAAMVWTKTFRTPRGDTP